MSCFLGIDAGTSGVKAVVMDASGALLGKGYGECDLITPRPSWVEQDPQAWWEACDAAVRQAVAKSGRGGEVAGIGFSGQMQGLTLMDKEMKPIGNCMIWLDQRASAEAEELNRRIDPAEALEITANHCLPSYWAAKLLWLRKNRPEDYERINVALFPKDYLRYRMTGEIATDVSDASCSWLLDMKKRAWSDRMFEVTGIPRSIVPERLLESQQAAGCLLPELAERWGLRPGIPLAAGGGDQTVGGVGCGIVRAGTIAATIGTSGVVFGACDQPFVDQKPRAMYSLCHSVPGKYCFLGCTMGAGGSFKWMRDTLFADKKQELAEKGGALIGINAFTLDGDEAAISEAKDVLAKKGATYQNVYFDSDGEAGKFTANIFAYPTTYVIDRNGNIVGEPIVGAITEQKQAETLQKLIDQALAADMG